MEQYYSAKWRILKAFDKGKLPKDIKCLGIERKTIYNYYQQWKREQDKSFYFRKNEKNKKNCVFY